MAHEHCKKGTRRYRLDILELRPDAATTADATYSFLQVRARGSGDVAALPKELTAHMRVESSLHMSAAQVLMSL